MELISTYQYLLRYVVYFTFLVCPQGCHNLVPSLVGSAISIRSVYSSHLKSMNSIMPSMADCICAVQKIDGFDADTIYCMAPLS